MRYETESAHVIAANEMFVNALEELTSYEKELLDIESEIEFLQHELEVWNNEDDFALHLERRLNNAIEALQNHINDPFAE